MKTKRTQRLEVVHSHSADDFQDQVNELYQRLGDQGIKFTDTLYNNENGFSAFVKYEQVEKIPECLKDEYELREIFLKCKDCPHYEPINNYEGRCDYCRGTLRRSDEVGDCSVFWEEMEAKETGNMYDALRAEIKMQFKTLYKFSEAIGVNNTFFSNKLAGRKQFSGDDKIRILRTLGIEVNEENLAKYFKAV